MADREYNQTFILEKAEDNSQLYSTPISMLKFDFQIIGDSVGHFKFTDNNASRYEVPLELWPDGRRPTSNSGQPKFMFNAAFAANKTFAFQISRTDSSNRILWDTTIGGLVYEDQYLQIATRLPSINLYGFGENVHQTFRHDFMGFKTWPLFARDQPPSSPLPESYANLYGVHPFYMCIEEDGQAHGVLLLNSNAMEYVTTPEPGLIYRTIGGILDFYIFAGPTPADVIAQYWSLIGRPMMPPYWAFGYQLSRYGYADANEVNETVWRNYQAGIPQETQVIDIDYMDRYRDFTIGAEFTSLPQLAEELHNLNKKLIIILDPAISAAPSDYQAFLDGVEAGAFVQWPKDADETLINTPE